MSRTWLEVGPDPAGGRARVAVRSDGPHGRGHLGVRVLAAGRDRVRVALVAEGAMLVAGDDVSVGMRVGPGVSVDVVEPAGTVAYDMRGGRASWRVEVEVAAQGLLAWRAEPFVVATGAHVDRRVDVRLEEGGVAVLREVLVLGRSSEAGGVLRQRFQARVGGRPLLLENLALDGGRLQVAALGSHRVMDSLTFLGRRAPQGEVPPGATRLELEGEGTLLRYLGAEVHASGLPASWPVAA